VIFTETKLLIADNSGAKLVKCIKILGKLKSCNKLCKLILVVINKKLVNKTTLIKKKIYFGLIIHIIYPNLRLDGIYLSFNKNRVILLTNNFKLLGTKVNFLLVKELNKKFEKLLIKAKTII
jgi:large subunit ribosomal protein L14